MNAWMDECCHSQLPSSSVCLDMGEDGFREDDPGPVPAQCPAAPTAGTPQPALMVSVGVCCCLPARSFVFLQSCMEANVDVVSSLPTQACRVGPCLLIFTNAHHPSPSPENQFFFFFGHAIWHVESYFPNQGLKLCPLRWKLRVLTTGPPGKSPRASSQTSLTGMSSTAPPTVLMPPSCSRIQGGTADPSVPLQVFSWLLGL